MMQYVEHFLFGIYPYIGLSVFLIGSLVRFERGQYTWRSGSSQMLRARQLRWGSNLFHIGILFLSGASWRKSSPIRICPRSTIITNPSRSNTTTCRRHRNRKPCRWPVRCR